MDLNAASAGSEMGIGGLVHPCTLAPCASRMAPFNPSDGGTLFFLFETGMTLAGFVYFCVGAFVVTLAKASLSVIPAKAGIHFDFVF